MAEKAMAEIARLKKLTLYIMHNAEFPYFPVYLDSTQGS